MADVSGAVNAIFTGYRKLLELYRTQVTGDPDALHHAAVKERRQAAAARAVADAIAASNSKLAKDWEAAEQVTFSTDGTTLTKKLTDTAQALGQSADRLTSATAAVTTARSAVDAEVELFRGRAALLLTTARNVADDQVTKLLDSAKKIGVDSVRQTQRISAELDKALAMLFGQTVNMTVDPLLHLAQSPYRYGWQGTIPSQRLLDPEQLRQKTDEYLFNMPLSRFSQRRNDPLPPHRSQLNWESDGCSSVPDQPLGYDFTAACERHDFGYRNYVAQGRFNAETKAVIDAQFRADLNSLCDASDGFMLNDPGFACSAARNVYHWGVRQVPVDWFTNP